MFECKYRSIFLTLFSFGHDGLNIIKPGLVQMLTALVVGSIGGCWRCEEQLGQMAKKKPAMGAYLARGDHLGWRMRRKMPSWWL
jgi:hypothetical protein